MKPEMVKLQGVTRHYFDTANRLHRAAGKMHDLIKEAKAAGFEDHEIAEAVAGAADRPDRVEAAERIAAHTGTLAG